MGANGKGNGKTPDAPPAEAPHADDGGPNEELKAEVSLEHAEEGPVPEPPPAPVPAPVPGPRGAAWARPIARFEAGWTWLESRLLTFVLVWQILALVAWVFLAGLSESVTSTAGTVFRVVLLAVVLGLGAWFGLRKQPEDRRRNLTLLAIAVAVGVVVLWHRVAAQAAEQKASSLSLSLDNATSGYFNNIKGWLQEGSTLTLLGGLRGLGTRLTLWLALLGGSLATAVGKHIHIDVVFRFIPRRARVPVSVVNYLAAATVCLAAVWGFFDHIAIESYGSRAEDRAGAKIDNALHHIGDHVFLTRKQLGLDLRSVPHVVLAGERYDAWMSAARWNEWVDGAGLEARYDPAAVKNIRIPDGAGTHPPFVVAPDGTNARGALVHTLGLVFPFGLFAIGLRFLIRALLTLSGHLSADPDEAHKEELGEGAAGAKGGA